jgi:hypothetical protein
VKRAAKSPLNLLLGAGAAALSAITWNPLPLILYGLYQPVGLYRTVNSPRFHKAIRNEQREAEVEAKRRQAEWLHAQLQALMVQTPVGGWVRQRHLPDYLETFGRLMAIREDTHKLVAARSSAARPLEDDIIERMDDMLRAYLMMAKERMLFHCALAKVYPQMPDDPPPAEEAPGLGTKIKRVFWSSGETSRQEPGPWTGDRRFVDVEEAIEDLRRKIAKVEADIERDPEHEEIYRPTIAMHEKRIAELGKRAANDRKMAAQLQGFPDQFDYILGSMAGTDANDTEVASSMQLLIEQTEETVTTAREMREIQRLAIG